MNPICMPCESGNIFVLLLHPTTEPMVSLPPEASRVPSGENDTENIQSVYSLGRAVGCLVAMSHNSIVPSLDAEASRVPSGENANEKT